MAADLRVVTFTALVDCSKLVDVASDLGDALENAAEALQLDTEVPIVVLDWTIKKATISVNVNPESQTS